MNIFRWTQRKMFSAYNASVQDCFKKHKVNTTVKKTIAMTTLRPDMVLFSESSRQVVLLELTVPWEVRTEEAFEQKRAKYEELAGECRNRGWMTLCFPTEVGCRGFVGQSLCRALKLLGIRGLHKNKAIRNIMDAAEKASRWLWKKEAIRGLHKLPRHKSGTGHPWLGHLGEGVWCWKTRNTRWPQVTSLMMCLWCTWKVYVKSSVQDCFKKHKVNTMVK